MQKNNSLLNGILKNMNKNLKVFPGLELRYFKQATIVSVFISRPDGAALGNLTPSPHCTLDNPCLRKHLPTAQPSSLQQRTGTPGKELSFPMCLV